MRIPRLRFPRLDSEWLLVTRVFGTTTYAYEDNARSDASQWNRYLLYRRRVIRFPARLVKAEGDSNGK